MCAGAVPGMGSQLEQVRLGTPAAMDGGQEGIGTFYCMALHLCTWGAGACAAGMSVQARL